VERIISTTFRPRGKCDQGAEYLHTLELRNRALLVDECDIFSGR